MKFLKVIAAVILAFTGLLYGEISWVSVSAGLPTPTSIWAMAAVPGQDKVIAGTSKQGMYVTTDGGASWIKLGTGDGSDVVNNTVMHIIIDPVNPDNIWECGMYGGPVSRSTDGGYTFSYMGALSHNDVMSVDFTDPLRRTVLVGSHEVKKFLQKTTNNGASWTNIGANLPDSAHFSSYPLIIDSLTYLCGCSGWGAGASGVYRTTDGGNSWALKVCKAANGPPLVTRSGVIFYGVLWDNGLMKSVDKGEHWTQPIGWGVLHTVTLAELPNGTLVGSSYKTNGLCSSTNAANWTDLGPRTAAAVTSIVYNEVRKTLFVSCRGSGVYRLNYDYGVHSISRLSTPERRQAKDINKMTGSTFTVPDLGKPFTKVIVYSVDGKVYNLYKMKANTRIKMENRSTSFIKCMPID